MRHWLCHRSPQSPRHPIYWLLGKRLGVLLPCPGYRLAIHLYLRSGWKGPTIRLWPLTIKLWP